MSDVHTRVMIMVSAGDTHLSITVFCLWRKIEILSYKIDKISLLPLQEFVARIIQA